LSLKDTNFPSCSILIFVAILTLNPIDLNNANNFPPNETKMIVVKLYELIKTGEINEIIDGGKLLALFRSIGLSVRMATKINIEQDGKFVSLSDKLSSKSSDDGDE